MTKENAIKLFQDQGVRVLWDEEKEKWFFSIVDIIGILTESVNPNNYWKVLKSRLKKEGSELVTNCNQLKMQSAEGLFKELDKPTNKKHRGIKTTKCQQRRKFFEMKV